MGLFEEEAGPVGFFCHSVEAQMVRLWRYCKSHVQFSLQEIAMGPLSQAVEKVMLDLNRIVPQFTEAEFQELRHDPSSAKKFSNFICGYILHSLHGHREQ